MNICSKQTCYSPYTSTSREWRSVGLPRFSIVRAATWLLSHFHVPLYLSLLSSFIPLIAVSSIQWGLRKYFCRSRGLCSYYVHDLIFLFFLPSSSRLLLPFPVLSLGLCSYFCLSLSWHCIVSLSYLLSVFFPSVSLVTYLLCVTTCQALG